MTEKRHIHSEYDQELDTLRGLLLEMGGLVERQLADGLEALITRDAELGDRVCTADYRINSLEVRIDEEATMIIARRQPTGSDLRLLMAAIRTGTDLERIGDEAEKLGRFAVEFAAGNTPEPSLLQGMERLGDTVRQVLRESLDAFARSDVAAATAVLDGTDRVGGHYDAVMRELITYMMEDPRTMQRALHALWCARALERISDHARNVCESVVYVEEGRNIRHRPAGAGPDATEEAPEP
ncbi:phosphate signaling complex protein PhoU [Halofilum ochraceum]|uniref:phosphate signaling complex protein PhoU n=1 Tax=Halofilum ochraceum TaxID=1611323 RepID=UPI0008378691|nr:phosphate signaling complex protein PhoU [Halofilum ochraceum]